MRGRTIQVQGHNPFMIRGSDGEEIPGTKLIISEIPISFSNTALEAALIKKALTLSVPQAVKRGSQILTFCTPSRETRLANKRLECESTIGR